MKYIVEKEVTNCNDCPAKIWHTGHGETFNFCNHPNAPRGYDSVLPNNLDKIPEWCPIKNKE